MNKRILEVMQLSKYITFGLIIAFFISCKKNDPIVEPIIDPFAIDKSKTYLSNDYENNLRDSVWYYYRTLSLWQDAIEPTSRDFNKIDKSGFIRDNYTKYFEKADDVLEYLMSLTKNKFPNRNPELNYDWYSFIDRGGSVSSGIQETISSGLGMSIFYLQTAANGNNADLYIKYVERNSAAELAGLQRGDKIISINGDSNLDYNFQQSKDFSPLFSYLNSSLITVKVLKPSGETIEKPLAFKSFASSPILFADVVISNQTKVGYLLFNSFASLRFNSSPTLFYSELEKLFTKFEQQGISELVIDLRNNGGGDVETVEYLANRIAPASESGKVMYTYQVNDIIKDWGWLDDGKEFAPIKFNKRGNLSLNRVYFLVSPNTASASELLINSLKPAMDTYIVGTYSVDDKNTEVADKTYGKPVGFFGIPVVDDHVELYVTSFKMYNRNGEGDYFDGLTPSVNVWEYSSFKNFGDLDESMFAATLNHIRTGSFTSNSTAKASVNRTSLERAYNVKENSLLNVSKYNSSMFKFKKDNIKKK